MEPVPVRPSIALVLLAACAGLLALGFWLLRPSGTGSVSFEPAPEETRPSSPAADLERSQDEARDGRRAASDVEPAPVRSRSTPSGLGTLRIRAVDAESGAALDRLRVRVASVARLADRESATGSAGLSLTLSPGSYWLLALSRGYEPLELPTLEIVAGEELAPEPLRMRRGSARVEGFAIGDLRPERQLRVELLGEGRTPCAECTGGEQGWSRSEPCTSCGYAHHSSRLALPPDGRFTFEHLVSGKYALRLLDSHGQPLGLGQSFELLEGQTLRLEPEAPAPRKVELELIDTDGSSLAAEWGSRVRAAAAEGTEFDDVIVFVESAVASADFACTFRADERYLGQASFAAPDPPDGLARGRTAVAVGRSGGRALGPRLKGPDDRPRARNESLRLDATAPVLQPATVSAGVGEDGLAHFYALPAIGLLLEITSGPFRASVAIPAGPGTARVKARLAPIEEGVGGTFREFERGLAR